MSKPIVFAHRGASAYQFENTMKAFERAVDLGADGIEFDVQLTEDGVPIVIHDVDLIRLAGIRQMISSLTSTEVSVIRVGKKYTRLLNGHRIPTLIEAVTFCERYRKALNIELKETVSERPETIKRIIEIADYSHNFHFSSFDYYLLEKVKAVNPRLETAYLVRKNSVDWNHLERCIYADGFHIHKRLLKDPYLSKLIQTGKKIRVYGMTGKEAILLDPPPYIVGWITDYPDRLIKTKD